MKPANNEISPQRRLLEVALVTNPETSTKSDHLLGEAYGLSFQTAARVRRGLVARGVIPAVSTRRGRDGIERDISLIGGRRG